jgi:hypothetical protein
MSGHLTKDELLDRLYGLGEAEGEANLHLQQCAGCADRLRAYERRRAEAAASPEVSSEFLAVQRRGIYARLEEGPQAHLRLAPALAAAFALAMGLILVYPGHPSHPKAPIRAVPVAHFEMSDEQLFSNVYSMEQSAEPRAAVPMHALFEDEVDGEQ